MKRDLDFMAFVFAAGAVLVALIAAMTYYNAYFPGVMARYGMCEVFKDPPRSFVWEKCK